MNLWCFLCFVPLIGQFGRCISEIPPQSLLFPIIATWVAFPKTPFVGTSPSNMLKDTFKCSKTDMFCITLGIDPDNRFLERSKYLRPLREAKEDGIVPLKELLCK
ncbi:putative LRR receptor serine/threonine-protein kinase [Trifolium repens]|nr:putative LRR receptor serine/threonine-protein kinase [Trifolium repens]